MLQGSMTMAAGQMGAAQQFVQLGQQAAVNAAPTPMTLVRAISLQDELNQRLYKALASAEEIASAIGGPRPTSDYPNATQPAQSDSAMARLNISVDSSHSLVTQLENALAAIRRSLGG